MLLYSIEYVDATHWLYIAELIYQGSSYPGSETKFWDMCALKVIAPITPMPMSQNLQGRIRPEIIMNFAPHLGSGNMRGGSKNGLSIITPHGMGGIPSLLHPHYPADAPPLTSIVASNRKVAVDQVVRLLGFPGNKDLSVDWGRVELNDPNGDILISLLSDDGSSGGPVVDREGQLIGLLSRSHQWFKFSCVQHLRNLFDIIRDLC